MTGTNFNAFTLSGATLLLALTLAPAVAQETEFNIEAQPLAKALLEFNEQSGLTVAARRDLVADKTAPAVHGEMEPEVALGRILSGTGLKSTQLASGGYTITVDAAGLGKYRSGRSPVPMARNQIVAAQSQTAASRSEATRSGRSDERGVGIVTGKVTDTRTGANLKGAKVTIEETGQWTATNDLGEFRLVNVPTGSVTLTVSFLGYADQSTVIGVHRDSIRQDFSLRGGSELEEIIVIGQRSARALALNRERTAANSSSVFSSDLLGTFTGTTISDALRIAPGVAFNINPETGEGDNITIRGLEPGFNQVTLNGVRLTNDIGGSRISNLSDVLTGSIESVTINKTLLPSQDGTGTGGLVEIETKSPLDRDKRFAQLSVEGVKRGEGFGQDRLYSGTISGVFGDNDDLGLSLSAQYRDLDIRRGSYQLSNFLLGQYLPEGISNANQIDPLTAFPFEDGVDLVYPSEVLAESAIRESENLSITASIERDLASHTNLRLDYTRSDVSSSDFGRTLFLNPLEGYELLPIDSLGGQERYTIVTERPDTGPFPGVLAQVEQSLRYLPNTESTTDTLSFRGTTTVGSFNYQYSAGYSALETSSEAFEFGISNTSDLLTTPLSDDELDPSVRENLVDGRVVSVFDPIRPGEDPGFVFPNFIEAYFSRINDIDEYQLSGNALGSNRIRDINSKTENERYSVAGSVRYDSSLPWLEYLEVGGFWEDYSFSSGHDGSPEFIYTTPDGVSLSDVGLQLGSGILGDIGLPASSYGFVSLESAANFRNNIAALSEAGLLSRTLIERSAAKLGAETTETEIAAYIEGKAVWRDFEVIGGFRFVDVEVDATVISRPSIVTLSGPVPNIGELLVNSKGRQSDFLPRILFNYRPHEDIVLRGGYYTSVARPGVLNLSGPQSVLFVEFPIFGPNSDQPLLSVSQANPDLKPSYTDNFDASVEWYTDDIGALKVSMFYKKVEDPFLRAENVGGIELAIEDLNLPDIPQLNDLPDNVFIDVSSIENGDDPIELWGAEISVERRFDFLPSWSSGFGVFANVGYADSSQTAQLDTASNDEGFVEFETELPGSPRYTATAAITYSKYGIDSSLTYTWQDRRLGFVDDFGLDRFESEFDQLDFRIVYHGMFSDRRFSLFFDARDLLRDEADPFTRTEIGGERGAPTYNGRDSTFFGGRSFAVGGSFTF